MTQIYVEKEEEKFREKVKEAYEKGFITKIQREALLSKFERRGEGEPLTIQDRNALRTVRNAIIHNQDAIKENAIYGLKVDTILNLLAAVDKQAGIYCHLCQEGILISRTVSSWIVDKQFEVIFEQKPAKVCSNASCQSASFSVEVENEEQDLLNELEKQVRAIRTTEPERLEQKKCPQCRSETLEANHTGEVYKYRQGLYHIKIHSVPLKAYCTLCHYQEVGEKVTEELKNLVALLDAETVKLLEMEG